jgi:hypothetical protein
LPIQYIQQFLRAREARQLNRDAVYIIEDATARFLDEQLTALVETTARELEAASKRLAMANFGLHNVLFDAKRLHREARRGARDVDLSAMTLVIIYLRSLKVGEAASPARETIAALLIEQVPDIEEKLPSAIEA